MTADRVALDSLLLWLDRYGERLNEALAGADDRLLHQRLKPDLPTLAEVVAHVLITENLYVRHVLGDESLPATGPAQITTTWDLQRLPVLINGRTILDADGRSPGVETLIAAHHESHLAVRSRLAAAADVQLPHFYDGPYHRGDTLAGVLAVLIGHEGYHLSECRLLEHFGA